MAATALVLLDIPSSVVWAGSESPLMRAGPPSAGAFLVLTSLKGIVRGITSVRNSRLSRRATALERSRYWIFRRGFRSDLTTLWPCSAMCWMNISWRAVR